MARPIFKAPALFISAIAMAAGVAVGFASSAASAQDALGDGRALDNNLRQGSNRVNPAGRDYDSELRYRNAIVTGNAPGGASFRGEVGYTAPEDFRSNLGSNDIFNFQRDSLTSGLIGSGLRGASSIQFQSRFMTGGLIDERTGIPLVRRSGSGASYGDIRVTPDQPASSLDPFSLRPGSLRSTSEFMVSTSLSPRVLGISQGEDGSRRYAVASPLRGIVSQNTPDYPSTMSYGFEAPEVEGWTNPMLQDRDDEADFGRRRQGGESRVSPLDATDEASNRVSGRVESEPASGRIEALRMQSEDILAQLRSAFEPTADETEEGDARDGRRPETPDPLTPESPLEPSGDPVDDSADDRLPAESDGAAENETEAAAPDPTTSRFDSEMKELRRRLLTRPAGPMPYGDEGEEDAGADQDERTAELVRSLLTKVTPRAENLAPPGDTDAAVVELMQEGERLLGNGRWFDAEERFASALRLAPDDPFAAAGRIQAQIGAGLFRSAAQNLERLLRSHPEMTPVRFGDKLLPGKDRIEVVRGLLRENIARDNDYGRDSALVLAYLGHQTGNTEDVRDGLDAIERIRQATGASHDPLLDVLRVVWLKEDAPVAK